jgi:hypothetical protein
MKHTVKEFYYEITGSQRQQSRPQEHAAVLQYWPSVATLVIA